ncbi:hypothetical protein L1077_13355 [Pseudoalteromonas luteoviolacea]|uniref:hypothetical protein n=1 Tax=Pseudoalteromonas luteoviolacea TaxID=43657 RepID=UPI001F413585|nr:hypothetical protein [Pseudoalteromonas luteoviolacea]MCF6440418.1 hypothetical protein [Pseudoalteromonas luteoviolacea]
MKLEHIQSDTGTWMGVKFKAPEHLKKPLFSFQSNSQKQIRCQFKDKTLFLGNLVNAGEGCWLIPNHDTINLLPAITSQDIQATIKKDNISRLRGWCSYFGKKLTETTHIFDQTDWYLAPYQVRCGSYELLGTNQQLRLPPLYINKNTIFNKHSHWIDWESSNGSCELFTLRSTMTSKARIKWYTKCAQQGHLPPILVIYVRFFDAYIVLDGHCRLEAALKLNISPDIISISPCQNTVYSLTKEQRLSMLHNLKNKMIKRPDKAQDTAWVNSVLLSCFAKTEYIHPTMFATCNLDPEQWHHETKSLTSRDPNQTLILKGIAP